DWRVMEDRDFPIGLQFGERLFEANSVIDGFLDELFDERFAPSIYHSPPKTAAESRDASESDSADFNGLAIQHVNASAIENFANKLGLSGFEIMVSEDCKHRNFYGSANIGNEFFRLFGQAVICQITAKQ